MRIGYLDCFSGISGDMYLGALVDAGVPLELLAMTAAALDIGAQLTARKVTRGGIAATKVDVLTDESSPDQTSAHNHTHDHSHDHGSGHADDNEHGHAHTHEPTPTRTHSHASHRSLSAILKIIDVAPFSDAVKTGSKMAFQLLGQAEAGIHAISVDNVHFHEIGGVDTIVDIVCAAAGCEALGVDRWMSSALNVGSGTVDCAHGTLPVPAPATLPERPKSDDETPSPPSIEHRNRV